MKAPPNKRAAISVLGVHHSGTSCLAHLLSAPGAKLPERLVGPGHSNPFGHWEPARLMEINEEILGAIGRSWHDPRPILQSWFRSREAYAFHERLGAAIASGYGHAPLIVIKEPRIAGWHRYTLTRSTRSGPNHLLYFPSVIQGRPSDPFLSATILIL